MVRDSCEWLLLDYLTGVAVLVKVIKQRLKVPGVKASVEGCFQLVLRRMCHEVFAVVEMVKGSCCYVMRNDDFFLRFTWNVGGGITFSDQ